MTDPPKKNQEIQDEISEDEANGSLVEETPQLFLSSHCEVKPKVYRSEFNVCITLIHSWYLWVLYVCDMCMYNVYAMYMYVRYT